jgi:hypothetical protein
MAHTVEPSRHAPAPWAACLVRVGWMIGGNAALALLGVTIMLEATWSLTAKDVAFWGIAVGVVALRYLDVARLGGQTARGEPATAGHVARYAAGVLGCSAVLWTMAQSVDLPG